MSNGTQSKRNTNRWECETKEIDLGGCDLEQKSKGWRKSTGSSGHPLRAGSRGRMAGSKNSMVKALCVCRTRDVTPPEDWSLGKQDEMKLARKRSQTIQSFVGHGQDLGVCPQGSKVMTYKGVSMPSSVSSPYPNCTYILPNKASCLRVTFQFNLTNPPIPNSIWRMRSQGKANG